MSTATIRAQRITTILGVASIGILLALEASDLRIPLNEHAEFVLLMVLFTVAALAGMVALIGSTGSPLSTLTILSCAVAGAGFAFFLMAGVIGLWMDLPYIGRLGLFVGAFTVSFVAPWAHHSLKHTGRTSVIFDASLPALLAPLIYFLLQRENLRPIREYWDWEYWAFIGIPAVILTAVAILFIRRRPYLGFIPISIATAMIVVLFHFIDGTTERAASNQRVEDKRSKSALTQIDRLLLPPPHPKR